MSILSGAWTGLLGSGEDAGLVISAQNSKLPRGHAGACASAGAGDTVDAALAKYRADQEITDLWEARERVVVAVTGGPESETLVRRASRIASKASAELLVVHVVRGDGLAGVSAATMATIRRLATDLGASVHTIVGDDVPDALLEFARSVNATQLVLGTSRHSRLARIFEEGIGATVVRESGPIDVHMVTHPHANRRWRVPVGRGSPRAGWPRSPCQRPRRR
jgi:two-component system sensor histidine kinase KdpD